MRRSLLGCAAGAAILMALSCPAFAQEERGYGPQVVPQTTDVNPQRGPLPYDKIDPAKPSVYYGDPAHANISGLWRPANGPRPYYYVEGKLLPLKGVNGNQVGFPYKPAWQKALDDRYAGEIVDKPYGDPSASCWPQGMFHNYIGYYSPVEINQTPGMVHIINERMTPSRRVYTDGRLHDPNFVPTSEGESIGHWEGDTLVVDTIGVRPEFSFGYHQPHSSKVHFVERFRRLDDQTLAIYFNIDDPIALTKPLETVLYFRLGPAHDKMSEDFCVENNRNAPDENLIVVVDIAPHKHYGFDLPEDK